MYDGYNHKRERRIQRLEARRKTYDRNLWHMRVIEYGVAIAAGLFILAITIFT